MLSWDEFDKELRDEYASFLSREKRRRYDVYEHSPSGGDSHAIKRAKAALDALDLAEGLAELESPKFLNRSATVEHCGFYGKLESRVYEGTYSLYNFKIDHFRRARFSEFFNKVVLIFAVYLLSSVCCSLVTAARNAKLRTPLFAYDAELSIDRHRLRFAF